MPLPQDQRIPQERRILQIMLQHTFERRGEDVELRRHPITPRIPNAIRL